MPLRRETGERCKGGLGSSSCRIGARMPKRKGHSKRESQGWERPGIFFSRVYIYAHRGIAARLFIDHGRRESDDERSPQRDVQTRHSESAKRKSRSWRITGAFLGNVFWPILP